MKGLLFTNFYLVHRSILVYTLIGIGVTAFYLKLTGGAYAIFSAITLGLVITMPVWEILKVESQSGYNKYVLTLPVSRKNIIQSYYLVYFLVVVIGVILFVGIFYVYGLFSEVSIDLSLLQTIAFTILSMLTLGAIIFPLIFMLGEEKSDFILLLSLLFMGLVVNSLRLGVYSLIEQPPLLKFNLDPLKHVPIILLLIGILIFLISFFISLFIYCKKEF
ncbi:ABC-2 transporter permease [Lysinibacillus sp. NPDC093210]|uniref:ABC-2 transporter permease n=1 Tax=Lysinibacillus sp. NPDC093210 TaxID=3364133 RepID=UPI00381AC0DF